MVAPLATVAVGSVLGGVFGWLKRHRVAPSDIGCSYRLVTEQGHAWRLFVAPFCHDEPLHLALSLVTLWYARALEAELGSLRYAWASLVLAASSSALLLGATHALAWAMRRSGALGTERARARAPALDVMTHGFTSVSVGCLAALAHRQPQVPLSPLSLSGVAPRAAPLDPGVAEHGAHLIGAHAPTLVWTGVIPFVVLFLAPLVVRRSTSVLAHVSGIVSGELLARGALDPLLLWREPYWAINALGWALVLLLASLKATCPHVDLPWIEYSHWGRPASTRADADDEGGDDAADGADAEAGLLYGVETVIGDEPLGPARSSRRRGLRDDAPQSDALPQSWQDHAPNEDHAPPSDESTETRQ